MSYPRPYGVNVHRVSPSFPLATMMKLLVEWHRYVVPPKMWISWSGRMDSYSSFGLSWMIKRRTCILFTLSWVSNGPAIMVGVRRGDIPVGDSGSIIAKICPCISSWQNPGGMNTLFPTQVNALSTCSNIVFLALRKQWIYGTRSNGASLSISVLVARMTHCTVEAISSHPREYFSSSGCTPPLTGGLRRTEVCPPTSPRRPGGISVHGS